MINTLPVACLERRGGHVLIRNMALAGFLLWLVLFVGGLIGYSGSKLIYTLFSVVFLVMLASGFYRQVSYSYLFLVIFLWLGFWLKLTVHTILGYRYVEPIGSFNGTAVAWDEVLWVAIVASIGVIVGRICYGFAGGRSTIVIQNDRFKAPVWYPAIRKWLWIIMMVVTGGVVIINAVYSIHQIGLAPRTILMWPLNAVISWMLNIGLATGIATLLWWDISLKKNISLPIYAILIEGFFASVAVLSRGTYIYHVIPQLFALYKNKKTLIGTSLIKGIFIAVIFIGLFIVSQSGVNTLRAYLYQTGQDFSTKIQMMIVSLEVIAGKIQQLERLIQINKALLVKPLRRQELEKLRIEIEWAEKQLKKLLKEKSKVQVALLEEKDRWEEMARSWLGETKMLLDEFVYQMGGGVFGPILGLAVDRWMGLEGVMAVQSYPNKGKAFFLDGIKEKREIGKVTLYQEVSKSYYRGASRNFQFASLPGAAAFLYYSGSLWVVMLGMGAFSLLILLIERVVDMLTANPLLCSLIGFGVANTVAQFGLAPRQDIPYYFMIFCAVLFIWFVQSRCFCGLLQKLGLSKSIQLDD